MLLGGGRGRASPGAPAGAVRNPASAEGFPPRSASARRPSRVASARVARFASNKSGFAAGGAGCKRGSGEAGESNPNSLLSAAATSSVAKAGKILRTVSRGHPFNLKAPFQVGERREAFGR